MSTELNGFYHDMDFDSYRAIPALNGSSIIHMRRSPMKYRWELDHPTPPTPEMELGTITHKLILEPEKVGSLAVWGEEQDQKVRRGKVWNDFCAVHRDEIILTKSELEAVMGMQRGALSHVPIRKYADAPGATEVSMFWRHPHTKRRHKARIDKIVEATIPILVDLKTTRDARPFRFGPQAYSLGYVVKMANYWNGYRILTGVEPEVKLLAIEKTPPYESVVYNVPRDLLILGLEELDNLIWTLDDCEKENRWPPAEVEELNLCLPPWANAESDTELDLQM